MKIINPWMLKLQNLLYRINIETTNEFHVSHLDFIDFSSSVNHLANQGFIEIGIHENIEYNQTGEVSGVEYVYEEREEQTNQIKRYHAILKSDEYYQMAKSSQKHALPFETFIRIFRPFMMGKYAIPDIPGAFSLLDHDKSGHIDTHELSSFIPLVRPDASPHLILHYLLKNDLNQDCQLNYQEFERLILSGIGRDIIIGKI